MAGEVVLVEQGLDHTVLEWVMVCDLVELGSDHTVLRGNSL